MYVYVQGGLDVVWVWCVCVLFTVWRMCYECVSAFSMIVCVSCCVCVCICECVVLYMFVCWCVCGCVCVRVLNVCVVRGDMDVVYN